MGYKLTGKEKFKAVAVKGMETIMASYPDTIREQSQTQEYCRLILPLSWLYWVTGEVKHRDWLYMVTNDLQELNMSQEHISNGTKDEKINGAGARGFDVEFMEVFGSPADVRWGPWAIESGWTVAEITSRLIMGLMEDKLIKFY